MNKTNYQTKLSLRESLFLMQGQCKPNAESSLYAEVQPVLAFRRQSYDENPLITNISTLFSPTCSDNRPQRRQIGQTPSKLVLFER